MTPEECKNICFQIKNTLEKSEQVLLICHKKPDGDSLGALCAMNFALTQLNKSVISACIDPVPEYLHFMPGADHIQKNINPEKHDLILTLDCGANYMTRYHEQFPDIFDTKKRTIINIDHHPSNDNFGTINLVDTDAAATSVIIYKLLQVFPEIKITGDMATCLLTGIYTDTGSFMHSNTTGEVYKTASALLKKGAKFRKITKKCFQTTPLQTLRLWGRVLSNIKMNKEGIIMSVVKEKDLKDCNATNEDIVGVIDLLNAVPEAKFSVLLTEDRNGNVKGSFRTQREDINLSEIAGVFGGGGHKKAAGFTVPGRLEKEVRWKVVQNEKHIPEKVPTENLGNL